MGLVEPTPYDLRWRMFGIQVRVHPMFWLVTAILWWNRIEVSVTCLLLGILSVFVSILLHELGHVFMGRAFGSHGHIILYSLGGLAVGSNALARRWQRILVCLAGPGIQLVFYAVLRLTENLYRPSLLGWGGITAWVAIEDLLLINLVWALVNLLPMWPLDGGQISRDL